MADFRDPLLDGALYESRMRYVSIAQQIAMV